jgi:CIC family chloride channel protein
MSTASAEPVRRTRRWQLGPVILQRILDRYQPPEPVVLLFTAVAVGVGAGLGAIAFRWLIDVVSFVSFTWLPEALSGLGRTYLLIAPMAGGLLVGSLTFRYAREAKGHGVPEVMAAVALRGGRIRPRVALIKALASSICIGSGGSVGREGPIVQIGSALGSSLGQLLRLGDDRLRSLVACGAAGGIAATFNAPIAGAMFALEVILGEFGVGNFAPVVLASVTANVVGGLYFGNARAFAVPSYAIRSLWEFVFYAVLGVAAAGIAVLYTRLIYGLEDWFDTLGQIPEWVRPAVGGLCLGSLALLYGLVPGLGYGRVPHIFGVGYETMERALLNQLGLGLMLALVLLKLVGTGLTLGSGGSGGVFAPSLFIGAMLGGSWGLILQRLVPDQVAPQGAYALVGMAAVFAGAAHAPITAILILFEMSGDYRIILPLMITVVISTFLARHWLAGESIYTLKLTRRGVRLSSGRDVDIMAGVRVEEAMTRDVQTVPGDLALDDLSERFRVTQHHGFPVVDDRSCLVGIVTIQDLKRALDNGARPDAQVRDIATTDLLLAYPDESMATALERLGVRGVGRLPVVSRQDPSRLLGAIRREDIVRAYRIALARRQPTPGRAVRAGVGPENPHGA